MNDERQPTVTDAVLCQEILAVLQRFKTTMATVAEAYGLTVVQLGALHAIHEGHVTMGKVAQTMRCDASNVTGIIDRLVAMKMVTRQEDSHDRRIKVLALTATGKAVLDHVTKELPSGLGCARLDDSERLGLHKGLCKLLG